MKQLKRELAHIFYWETVRETSNCYIEFLEPHIRTEVFYGVEHGIFVVKTVCDVIRFLDDDETFTK